MAKLKVITESKQVTLNRLLVERALTGVDNPMITKLQADLDLLNYGIVLKKC